MHAARCVCFTNRCYRRRILVAPLGVVVGWPRLPLVLVAPRRDGLARDDPVVVLLLDGLLRLGRRRRVGHFWRRVLGVVFADLVDDLELRMFTGPILKQGRHCEGGADRRGYAPTNSRPWAQGAEVLKGRHLHSAFHLSDHLLFAVVHITFWSARLSKKKTDDRRKQAPRL